MKILIINHYAGSKSMGMEHRPYYLAMHWQQMGAQVLVVTAQYSHLRGQNFSVQKRGMHTVDNVLFYVVPTGSYCTNRVDRAVNTMQFLSGSFLSAHEIAARFTPDVVIASSTYPLDMFLANYIKRMTGCKTVFELHDIWPMSIVQLHDLSPYSPFIKLLAQCERYSYEKSDMVVSLLPNAREYILKKRFRVKKYLHIPNGIELEQDFTEDIAPMICQINQLHKKCKFLLGYAGGFAGANCTDSVAKLVKTLGKDIGIVMIGAGENFTHLRKEYAGVENLLILPWVSQGQLVRLLAKLDCLYIPTKDYPIYRYGIAMNKLFDYMLSGRPVILGADSKNNPIEKSGCGLVIAPNDTEALQLAVKKMMRMGEAGRFILGRNGKVYVMKYHGYKAIAAFYIKVLRGLVENE